MRHIKPYRIYENSSNPASQLTEEQIDFLNRHVKGILGGAGNWKYYPDTNTVDVEDSFVCNDNSDIKDLMGIQFEKCFGDFEVHKCSLETLKGSPKYIGGNFHVYDNKLESLEYFPLRVSGTCDVSGNSIVCLDGLADSKLNSFFAVECNLITTQGISEARTYNFGGNPISQELLREGYNEWLYTGKYDNYYKTIFEDHSSVISQYFEKLPDYIQKDMARSNNISLEEFKTILRASKRFY
jgi:hypothetical protein